MGVTSIEWTSYVKDDRVVPGYTFNPWRGCAKVSPRRLVLLAQDGTVARVLSEPSAVDALVALRKEASKNPAPSVALEWLKGTEWVRWVISCQ